MKNDNPRVICEIDIHSRRAVPRLQKNRVAVESRPHVFLLHFRLWAFTTHSVSSKILKLLPITKLSHHARLRAVRIKIPVTFSRKGIFFRQGKTIALINDIECHSSSTASSLLIIVMKWLFLGKDQRRRHVRQKRGPRSGPQRTQRWGAFLGRQAHHRTSGGYVARLSRVPSGVEARPTRLVSRRCGSVPGHRRKAHSSKRYAGTLYVWCIKIGRFWKLSFKDPHISYFFGFFHRLSFITRWRWLNELPGVKKYLCWGLIWWSTTSMFVDQDNETPARQFTHIAKLWSKPVKCCIENFRNIFYHLCHSLLALMKVCLDR